MNSLKGSPDIGDEVVIGNWDQFKSTVSAVEPCDGKRVLIHIKTEYPEDEYFSNSEEYSKVWLHDEGNTWYRKNSYAGLN